MGIKFSKIQQYFNVPNTVDGVLGTRTYGVHDVSFCYEVEEVPCKIEVQLKPNVLGKILGFDEIYTHVITSDNTPKNFSPEMITNLINKATGDVKVNNYVRYTCDVLSNVIYVPDMVALKKYEMDLEAAKNDKGSTVTMCNGGGFESIDTFPKNVYDYITKKE